MKNVNTPAVLEALDRIFDKAPTVQGRTVKVTLAHEVAPEQFGPLAELSTYLGQAPAIMRSGAGVSVVFNF